MFCLSFGRIDNSRHCLRDLKTFSITNQENKIGLPSISTQFVDLFVSEGLVKTHIKIHKVTYDIRKKILPISGTLVTVCNPGLLNGDFSSDVFDLLQRSSGMPKKI